MSAHPPSAGLISVIMPCFNAATFVDAAVRSALEQDYGNVELVAVDDGSTDGTRELLEQLARRNPVKMRMLTSQRTGPYPARNLALRAARGEFVAFLDADDYWSPTCLRELHARLTASASDLAYCGWQNLGDGAPGTEPYVPPSYEADDIVSAFLRSCPWPIHAALMRRSVIDSVGGFSERCFTSMDYDLWLRILGVTRKITRVPEVLAYYRWHGKGQISSVKWRQVLDAWRVRRDFVSAHPDMVSHLRGEKLRELVDGSVLRAGYQAYWKRDLVSARCLFRRAMLTRCWHARDLKYLLPSVLPERLYCALISAADNR